MSAPLRPSLLPQCTSCARRLTKLGLQEWQWRPSNNTFQQQIRGKKKMVNNSGTVTVRLLKDVQTFGRKGSYVPISTGQMRNEWFPKRVAEYVTDTHLKELKTKQVTTDRDFQFGLSDPSDAAHASSAAALGTSSLAAPVRPKPASKTVEVELLTPERSTQLLNILVPPRLDFYRQPIEAAPQTPAPTPPPAEPRRQQRSASGAAADLLAARSTPAKSTPSAAATPAGPVAIYGSISTADIANAVKAIVAENDEAARIVFAEEDVRFVNLPPVQGQASAAETDKIKHLGDYEVEIRIKGADVPVKKAVRVLPQDKQDTTAL